MIWGKEQDDAVLFYFHKGEEENPDRYRTNVIDDSHVVIIALREWRTQYPHTRTCKITIDHTGTKCRLRDISGDKVKEGIGRSGVSDIAAVAWALWRFLEADWK